MYDDSNSEKAQCLEERSMLLNKNYVYIIGWNRNGNRLRCFDALTWTEVYLPNKYQCYCRGINFRKGKARATVWGVGTLGKVSYMQDSRGVKIQKRGWCRNVKVAEWKNGHVSNKQLWIFFSGSYISSKFFSWALHSALNLWKPCKGSGIAQLFSRMVFDDYSTTSNRNTVFLAEIWYANLLVRGYFL